MITHTADDLPLFSVPNLPAEDDLSTFMVNVGDKYGCLQTECQSRRTLISCFSSSKEPRWFHTSYVSYLQAILDCKLTNVSTILQGNQEPIFADFTKRNVDLRVAAQKTNREELGTFAKILGNSMILIHVFMGSLWSWPYGLLMGFMAFLWLLGSYGITLLRPEKFRKTELIKGDQRYNQALSDPCFVTSIPLGEGHIAGSESP